jgi:hypothetical protein
LDEWGRAEKKWSKTTVHRNVKHRRGEMFY